MSTTTPERAGKASASGSQNGNGAPASALALRNVTAEIEKQRAFTETMAAIHIARSFPRDEQGAIDRILMACSRPELAETAMYAYARGGTEITGPSIRLAEAIARAWGNFQFGIRELEQRHGESTVEAFAWDVETNVRSVTTFQVAHKRHTRERTYDLTDPRDIYELVANQGARRVRSRILALIDADIVQRALDQVEITLRTKIEVTPDLIKKIIDDFEGIGVTKKMLEAKIQRNITAVTPALVVQIGKWFNSIRDGMGQVSDFFVIETASGASTADAIKAELAKKTAPEAAAAPPDEKPPTPEPGKPPSPEAALAAEQDEKAKRGELRTKVAEIWKDIPVKGRESIMTRLYGAKKSVIDLTTAQLEDLVERLPEILSQP